VQPFPSGGRDIPDEGPERVGYRVDEGHRRACDDRLVLAVDHVSVQWLRVGRDEDCDGAVDTLGHDALVNREGNGGVCATDEHLTVEAGGGAGEGRRGELKGRSGGDGASVSDRQTNVSLDTGLTGSDERGDDGNDLAESEGDVERLRDGRGALEEVEDGLMTRFDGGDGSGHGEDARVIDEVDSTEVPADADVLDESGARHHGWDIREQGRRVKRAIQRRPAEGDEGSLDGGDVGGLVGLDGREGGDGDLSRGETGVGKVGRVERLQRLLVELRLERLEGGSEGQDLDGGSVSGTWKWRSRHGERSKESSSRDI